MSERRTFRATGGLLLALPLVAIVATLVAGGLARSFGPRAGVPSEEPTDATVALLPTLPGLGEAEGDYPPDRFWERVDGAADRLIAAGCTRLLFWRSADPAAEAEVLLFEAPDGAAALLAHDVGPDRTPGPGDEASVSEQAIFFRRGNVYVRVVGDALAPPHPERLLGLAQKVDAGIAALAGGGST